jgi:hypothetical protein
MRVCGGGVEDAGLREEADLVRELEVAAPAAKGPASLPPFAPNLWTRHVIFKSYSFTEISLQGRRTLTVRHS